MLTLKARGSQGAWQDLCQPFGQDGEPCDHDGDGDFCPCVPGK